MNTTSDANLSVTLSELSRLQALRYLPSIIITAVFMVPGIFGNLLVLIIYSRKFQPSNHKTFILALALFDFLSSFVGMPGFIAEIYFPYTFTLTWLCRAMRFIFYFTPTASAVTLLLIAYERFRKIYYPLKSRVEMSIRWPLFVCGFAAPCVISVPGAILNGHSTAKTGVKNITGVQCNIADEYKYTVYPTIYNGVQILIIIVDALLLTVFYGCIWKKISNRSNFYRETEHNKSSTEGRGKLANDNKNSMSDLHVSDSVSVIAHTSTATTHGTDNGTTTLSVPQRHGAKDMGTRKITKIMTVVTAVFLLSFLPHLFLILISVMIPNIYDNLSDVTSVLMQIALRSLFIQCVMNPFIYGYMDDHFRKACRSCLFGRNLKSK